MQGFRPLSAGGRRKTHGGGLFLFFETDDLVDLVVLDIARVREDDELAEKADREELQAEHDEQ